MKTLKTASIALPLAAVLLIATAALAVTNWSVQGVIDWTPLGYGPDATVHKVDDDGWNLVGQTLSTHAGKDGFAFLSKDDGFGKPVTFGTLAGAAGLVLQKPIDPPYIDFYRIWVWADVNANGQADPGDLVDGAEQSWQILLQKGGAPGSYDTESGEAQIGNLLYGVPDDKRQLQPGMYYLLLMEVFGDIHEGDEGTYSGCASSLQFAGGVAMGSGDQIVVEYTEKLPSAGWDATDPDLKYFTKAGDPLDRYGYPDYRDNGVDNFEVLWVRVNNPPRGPRH